MLIVALILAMIGLAALVTAVATSNELIAWVCIGASGLGIFLLIVDAIRDRARRGPEFPVAVIGAGVETTEVIQPVEVTEVIEPVLVEDRLADEISMTAVDSTEVAAEEPAEIVDEASVEILVEAPEDLDEDLAEDLAEEDHPDELVYDDPDFDTPSDDEADYPEPAEEAAIHTVDESDLAQDLAEDLVQDTDDEIATEGAPDSVTAGDESAIEVRYAPSAEDGAHTVVYTYADSTETENVDIEETPVGDQPRDQ